jgi:hypothetical protein
MDSAFSNPLFLKTERIVPEFLGAEEMLLGDDELALRDFNAGFLGDRYGGQAMVSRVRCPAAFHIEALGSGVFGVSQGRRVTIQPHLARMIGVHPPIAF